MKYLNKSFTVAYGQKKEYRDNYEKIDWNKKEEEIEIDEELFKKIEEMSNQLGISVEQFVTDAVQELINDRNRDRK